MKLCNRVRAKVEVSKDWERRLSLITNNLIYRRFAYWVALRKIKKIKKYKELGFAVEVSSLCNARCFFCPHHKMKRKKTIMSNQMFGLLLKRIKEEKIRPKYFNLTGTGEPLLDKDLFNKIKMIKNVFKNTLVFFPTNFFSGDKNVVDQLMESDLDQIIISLNAGNAVDYKKIMGLDFKKTIGNLNHLLRERKKMSKKLIVSLTVAANPINSNGVYGFIKKWSPKVDDISINWIHSWAGAMSSNNGEAKVSRYRYPCRSLFEQVVVQSNGNIPLCCVDYEGSLVAGNIKRDKILDSFYSEKLERVRREHVGGKIEKNRMCRNCRFSEKGLDWLI